jgi:hypothetical protein
VPQSQPISSIVLCYARVKVHGLTKQKRGTIARQENKRKLKKNDEVTAGRKDAGDIEIITAQEQAFAFSSRKC